MNKWLWQGRTHAGPRQVAAEKPKRCPNCGSTQVARIQYGEPAFDAKLEREMAEGRVVLGGCCVTDDDPSWQCVDCGEQMWRTQQSL